MEYICDREIMTSYVNEKSKLTLTKIASPFGTLVNISPAMFVTPKNCIMLNLKW